VSQVFPLSEYVIYFSGQYDADAAGLAPHYPRDRLQSIKPTCYDQLGVLPDPPAGEARIGRGDPRNVVRAQFARVEHLRRLASHRAALRFEAVALGTGGVARGAEAGKLRHDLVGQRRLGGRFGLRVGHGMPSSDAAATASAASRSRRARRSNSCMSRLRPPCFVFAARIRSIPSAVRGPVLRPPWRWQRCRPRRAGQPHGIPRRLRAPHLDASVGSPPTTPFFSVFPTGRRAGIMGSCASSTTATPLLPGRSDDADDALRAGRDVHALDHDPLLHTLAAAAVERFRHVHHGAGKVGRLAPQP
jgi:hypothetical protein